MSESLICRKSLIFTLSVVIDPTKYPQVWAQIVASVKKVKKVYILEVSVGCPLIK